MEWLRAGEGQGQLRVYEEPCGAMQRWTGVSETGGWESGEEAGAYAQGESQGLSRN